MTTPLKNESKFFVFEDTSNPNAPLNPGLNFHEYAFASVLGHHIRNAMKSDTSFLKFNAKIMLATMKARFSDQYGEEVLNSVWRKTRLYVIQDLEKNGDAKALDNEKNHQLYAVAKMWSMVCKDYSTHTPEECKGLAFHAIFTKRQMECILKYDT